MTMGKCQRFHGAQYESCGDLMRKTGGFFHDLHKIKFLHLLEGHAFVKSNLEREVLTQSSTKAGVRGQELVLTLFSGLQGRSCTALLRMV